MKGAAQSGKTHVNSRGKQVEAKRIKLTKDCFSKCKFKCRQKFNEAKQEKIFLDFYKLDTTGKHSFINQTSVCVTASSKTGVENSSEEAKKKRKAPAIIFLMDKSLIV